VPSSSGEPVSLSNLARIELKSAMLSVERMGQFPASTISFNLADGMALSDAVEEISRLPQEIGMPGSIDLRYQGAAKAFQESQQSTLLLLLAAVVVMYIVLGVLYENFIHPVTILSTLPS